MVRNTIYFERRGEDILVKNNNGYKINLCVGIEKHAESYLLSKNVYARKNRYFNRNDRIGCTPNI